jgi:hypothetical protein|tara:strand:+ start:69 stop:1181 length:1113 start_codon:yes stop_codon:yes gene_type:complete
MSTIAVNAITDANAGNTTSINGVTPNANNVVGKNIIINGAMQIAQRGTSSNTTGYTTVDRFSSFAAQTDELAVTLEQSTDAPDGFSNSFKWTTTTAETTINSDEHAGFQTRLEGQSVQQLAHGTSSAKKVTLSFWVKSSVTGTFAISIFKSDSFRIIGSTYAINSANSWEKKTITIDGDTSGAIPNDNSNEFQINWLLAAGSALDSTDNTSWGAYTTGNWAYGQAQDSVLTTTNATWQITGVQLEVGESATEFEHRPYGTELSLCQRYYFRTASIASYPTVAIGYLNTSTQANFSFQFPVEMRASPSSSYSGCRIRYQGGSGTISGIASTFASSSHAELGITTSSIPTGYPVGLQINGNATNFVAFSAEL